MACNSHVLYWEGFPNTELSSAPDRETVGHVKPVDLRESRNKRNIEKIEAKLDRNFEVSSGFRLLFGEDFDFRGIQKILSGLRLTGDYS